MSAERSLYKTAISALLRSYERHRAALSWLPDNILFDIFYQIYENGTNSDILLLQNELSDYELLSKLLRVGNRGRMHKIVQFCHSESFFQLLSKSCHIELLKIRGAASPLLSSSTEASSEASPEASTLLDTPPPDLLGQKCRITDGESDLVQQRACLTVVNVASFLGEAGWFQHAEAMLETCYKNLGQKKARLRVELLSHLLSATSNYCKFETSQRYYTDLLEHVNDCDLPSPLKCRVYNGFSKYYFLRSEYQAAYTWSIKALMELEVGNCSPRLVVDILRQASKSCVLKREFAKAEMLIKQAVCLCREEFGTAHAKYADVLIDYGFYLLNIDSIGPSMQVYQNALTVRLEYFGGNNLKVGIAHEDLAYVSYVFEYGPGNFDEARNHAESSLKICKELLPEDHLLLASPKRVLALILEEIAIDSQETDPVGKERLLDEAEQLHLFALKRSLATFGERNVQTTKHRGNLGRLYQTMARYEEAERMHLKAIRVKEELLGAEDYEVALSLGHLASLYNYEMHQYHKAEELYLRSIQIGLKLFGRSYSGLEYDYRGLIQVYESTENEEKLYEYSHILQAWNILKDNKEKEEEEFACAMDVTPDISLQEVISSIKSFPESLSTFPSSSSSST